MSNSGLFWAFLTTWLKAQGAQELAHSMKPKQDLSSTPVGLQRNNTSVWKVKAEKKVKEGPTDLALWEGTHCSICSKDGRQDALVFGCPVVWNLIDSSRSWGRAVHCFWSTFAGFTLFTGTKFIPAARTTTWIVRDIRRFPWKAHTLRSPKALKSVWVHLLGFSLTPWKLQQMQSGGNKVIFQNNTPSLLSPKVYRQG